MLFPVKGSGMQCILTFLLIENYGEKLSSETDISDRKKAYFTKIGELFVVTFELS